MNIIRFAPILLLAGCATAPAPTFVIREVPVAISTTNRLDVIRFPGIYRPYQVGRRIDPTNPTVLHESHVLYLREQPERWNLQPSAVAPDLPGAATNPAAVPLPLEEQLRVELRRQVAATHAIEAQSDKLRQVTDSIGPLMQSAGALNAANDERQRRLEERVRILEAERGNSNAISSIVLTNR